MRAKMTRRVRWTATAGGAVCAMLLMAPGASATALPQGGWDDELIQLTPNNQLVQGGWDDELIQGGWDDELIRGGWDDELIRGGGGQQTVLGGWDDELI